MRDALAATVLILASCADYTNISGKYVGDASGSYRTKDGVEKSFTIPGDTLIVKMTSRHYQHSEIEVTVRGCRLASNGNAGEKSWTLSSGSGGGSCVLDLPPYGAVRVKASGGLMRRPESSSSKVDHVRLIFSGDTDDGDSVRYSIDAKPTN